MRIFVIGCRLNLWPLQGYDPGVRPRSGYEGIDCDLYCKNLDRPVLVTCWNLSSLHRNDPDLLIGGLSAQDFVYPVL